MNDPDASLHLFKIPPFSLRISALDETAELVEMLARVMRAGSSKVREGICVSVLTSSDVPDPDGLAGIECPPESWRSYWVRDRVLISESPSRHVYLCSVPGYPTMYPWPQVRWHLVSFIAGGVLTLLSDRLLLIHGALITDGDAGYVLAGPSGSGKSTAAGRVPPPWEAMADDMLAAVATEDGYALMPLPTWSNLYADPDAPYAVETGRSVPLSGLSFLEPSPVDARVSLSRTATIRRLMQNALDLYGHYWSGFGLDDRVRLKGCLFRHARRIAENVPCAVLMTTRHGRFWDYVGPG